MGNTYTTTLNLAKPSAGDYNWDDEINGNFDILDSVIGLEHNSDGTHVATLSGTGYFHTIHGLPSLAIDATVLTLSGTQVDINGTVVNVYPASYYYSNAYFASDVYVGGINLNATTSGSSGATLIGVFDSLTNASGTNVQDVLEDLDAALSLVSNPSHSGLFGLDADDHTQYLLADGFRPLEGNWNTGNYSLTIGNNIVVSGTGEFVGVLTISDLVVGGTTVTGTSLVTLTDGSNADVLHAHDIGASTHGELTDMPDIGGTNTDHDNRYYTETEVGSTTSGTSGATLVGVYDNLIHSTNNYLQGVLEDFDTAITNASGIGEHNIQYHSDTDATGTELNILTDGSNSDSLHVHTSTAVTDFDLATVEAYGGLMLEPTGFVNRTDSSYSFNNSIREFTISGTYDIYYHGNKITKTAPGDVTTIPDVNGLHYITYDENGNLQNSVVPWEFDSTSVFVATVYWEGTTGLVGDERHGITMGRDVHHYLHKTVGARYESGLTGSFTNTTFSITLGEYLDEDINHYIDSQTVCRVLYRNISVFNYTAPQASYYYEVADIIQYDNGGVITDVNNNSYVAYWIFVTNDLSSPIYSLMGQRQDNSLSSARENNTYESLSLGTLPFAEMKLLYRVILKRSGLSEQYVESTDYRPVSNLTGGSYLATNHSILTGLQNDDHVIYSLVDGTRVFTGPVTIAATHITVSGTTVSGTQLATLTDGSNADALHVHTLDEQIAHDSLSDMPDIGGSNTDHDARYYTESEVDTISGTLSSEIDSDISTHTSNADVHHTESHTIFSHSDTTASGTELNTLTDGSNADALHAHDTGASTHGELTDMPDVSGTNTDHDDRYYTKDEVGDTTSSGSGAGLVGVYDEFGNSSSVDLQSVLRDFDLAITTGGGSSNTTKVDYSFTTSSNASEDQYMMAGGVASDNTGYGITRSGTITDLVVVSDEIPASPVDFIFYVNDADGVVASGSLTLSASKIAYDTTLDVDLVAGNYITAYIDGGPVSRPVFSVIGQFGATASSGTGSGVTDHGDLTGVLDDDHTQYLLADGSRPLEGDWNTGNYDIIVGGNITTSGTMTVGTATVSGSQISTLTDGSDAGALHIHDSRYYTQDETGPGSLTWIPVSFENSWVNFGSGYQEAEYTKDVFGVVHVRAVIKTGSGVVCTLPVGYRPPANLIFAGIAAGADHTNLYMKSDGTVTPSGGSVSTSCSFVFSFYTS